MKHYIQIEIPKPPVGATDYNPRYSLGFEKREGENISVWDCDKWNLIDSKIGRSGSYPILENESNKGSVSEDKELQKILEEAAEQLDPSYAWYDQKERRELANRLRKKSAEIFDC